MAQSRVKILFSSRHPELDAQLGAWLEERAGQITIRSIVMDSNKYGHNLTILYDETPGPLYQGRVLYHTRHTGLEEQVNAALADAHHVAIQFLTVGANEYGHCLCLIGEVRTA